MQSKATTVAQYLSELPPERQAALAALQGLIRQHLDPIIEEGVQYGMIGYYIPHRVFPAGYHCDPKQPLPFGSLASQKNHMALYLMPLYGNPELERAFRERWAQTGKKLDMGKSCIRFKKLDDLALDVIAWLLQQVSAQRYIATYQAALSAPKQPRTAKSKAARTSP